MATPTAPAVRSRLDALLAALTTTLMVVGVGLVGWGIVQPSPEPDRLSPYTALTPGQPLVRSKKINAPVVPIEVSSDAVLDPPSDPQQVGWWDASARPGSERGQTVITGHTVHTGGGAMDRVVELRRGDVVEVVTRKGTMRYRVSGHRELTRPEVADQAQALFGQDRGAGTLVLITCTDWNGSYYEKNVVITGRPLGQPRSRTDRA
jgi:LPXTG-site transpeptidase (sortase) family protein